MRTWIFLAITALFAAAPAAFAQDDCPTCYVPATRIMDPSMASQFRQLCDRTIQRDPACEGIEESKLLNCEETQAQNKLVGDLNFRAFLSCARGFLFDSMADLANMVIDLIKFLVGTAIRNAIDLTRFMLDENFRAQTLRSSGKQSRMVMAFLGGAVRNFANEYPQNLRAEQARNGMFDPTNMLRALGTTLLKPLMTMMTDAVTAIAQSQLNQFNCLNRDARIRSVCAMVGGFVLPPAAIFGFLKFGVQGIKAVAASKRGMSFMDAARNTFKRVARTPASGGGGATKALRAPDVPPRPPGTPRPKELAAPRPRDPVTPAPDPVAPALPDAPIPYNQLDVAPGGGRALGDVPVVPDAPRTPLPARGVASPDELARVARLSDDARIAEAQTLLGRELSEAERTALLDAHYVGRRGPDGQLLPESEWRGFGTYTADDIAQKARILADNGFDLAERRLLMDRGLAGGMAAGRVDAEALQVLRRDWIQADDAARTAASLARRQGATADDVATARRLQLAAAREGERYALASGMDYMPSRIAWEAFERAGSADEAARLRLAFARQNGGTMNMAVWSDELLSWERAAARVPPNPDDVARLATLRKVDDALRIQQGLPTREAAAAAAREAARREAAEVARREAAEAAARAEREAAEAAARAEAEAAETAQRAEAAALAERQAADAAIAAERAKAVDWPLRSNTSAYNRAAEILTQSIVTGNGAAAQEMAERLARLSFKEGFEPRTEFVDAIRSNLFKDGLPRTDLGLPQLRRMERMLETIEPVWIGERVQPGKLPDVLDDVRTAIQKAERAAP